MQENPKARVGGLEVQELSDEVLIYDLSRRKAHCLNRSVAMVWQLCDGSRDAAALALALGQALGRELDMPLYFYEDLVLTSLQQLSKAQLLTTTFTRLGSQEGLSRREIVRLGGGLALLPTIASLLAPRAAAAASCSQRPLNSNCPCFPPGINPKCKEGVCQGNKCK